MPSQALTFPMPGPDAFPGPAIALLCGLIGLTPLRGNLRPRYGAFSDRRP